VEREVRHEAVWSQRGTVGGGLVGGRKESDGERSGCWYEGLTTVNGPGRGTGGEANIVKKGG